jgi:rhodanese-related sulfurtransferase
MKLLTLLPCLGFPAFAFVGAALAISPVEVQKKIDAGEKVTFVDVRTTSLFRKGHIPGAISVPASLVPEKQLPPLGLAVVYDEGLGREAAQTAADALSQKPGTSAVVLDGGLAGWETAHAPTTQPAGMVPEELPLISYDHLKKTPADQVTLIDLRGSPLEARATAGAGTNSSSQPLTDLAQEFPGVRVSSSPFALPPVRQSVGAASVPPLLVLIDNNDGKAAAMARTLKANGIKRFVILAGGETILARKGQSGLQRTGSTIILRKPSPATMEPNPPR